MQLVIPVRDTNRQVDTAQGVDLSIRLHAGLQQVNCFWAPPVEYWPVEAGDFVGSTQRGGPVNFFNVRFNPHGNGTHTECVGHIAREPYILGDCLKENHFLAQLLSIYPQMMEHGDRVIQKVQLDGLDRESGVRALVIRTLPNDDWKRHTQYSGANPPYLHHEALEWLAQTGIEHLIIDLPSVDREEDGGKLLGHKAFWQYPGPAVRTHCTITELAYIPNSLKDGLYLLNLQTANFDLDVSPSRPMLYPLVP
jgi:arylformamidase